MDKEHKDHEGRPTGGDADKRQQERDDSYEPVGWRPLGYEW